MPNIDLSSGAAEAPGPTHVEPPLVDAGAGAAEQPAEPRGFSFPRFAVHRPLSEVLAGARVLTVGETGAHVLEVETALDALGYRLGGRTGPDRELTRGTQRAIARFQRERGLTASGDLDAATLAALDEAAAGRTPGRAVERGNPWRDSAGRFTSARHDAVGIPRYVPRTLPQTLRDLAGEPDADDTVTARIFLDDPSQSQAVEVGLPRRWFSIDERGVPLPGPVGPRVSIDVRAKGGSSLDAESAVASALTGDFLVAEGADAVGELTAFATANRTLEMAERYAGERIDWGKRGCLTLFPFNSRGRDAAYTGDTREVALGYVVEDDPDGRGNRYLARMSEANRRALRRQGALIGGAEIPDIVAHEAGHALLHALAPRRRNLLEGGPEWPAVHEAFGDITALLSALNTDAVLDAVVKETGGDLSRSNRAARIGEAWGIDRGVEGARERNALHHYPYDPQDRPAAPHDQSVSMSAAVYDALRRITDDGLARGLPPRQAITEARDVIGRLVFAAVKRPIADFSELGAALLAEDLALFGGRHTDALKGALRELRIVPPRPPVG